MAYSVKLSVLQVYMHNFELRFWTITGRMENDKLGWRLDYNMKHRGDVYATHGLGPVAQALDIHRGDRMENAGSHGH